MRFHHETHGTTGSGDGDIPAVHLKVHDDTRSMKTCEICGNRVLSGSFGRHKKIHENSSKKECDICGKAFFFAVHLRGHVATIHK